jgi:tetratricopeptide (TPR) repeat protein
MTALILYALLWLWDHRTIDSVTKANERKVIAEKAFAQQKYKDAAILYEQITYGSIFSEPASRLNLAHAYYKDHQLTKALKQYQLLTKIEDRVIASVSNNQIALIKVQKKDTAGALQSLKAALKLEYGNETARANYILLKSSYSGVQLPDKMESSGRQPPSQQEKSQPAGGTKEQTNSFEVEKSDKKEQLLSSLKAMNMTEEQARTILDAMKSNESQYIYQLRRKQYAEKAETSKIIEW